MNLSFNRYSIDQHDYSVRLKAARKFLKDGDKVTQILEYHILHRANVHGINILTSSDQFLQVKVIVNLKGRENEFRNIAIELIRRFQNDVGEVWITTQLYYC